MDVGGVAPSGFNRTGGRNRMRRVRELYFVGYFLEHVFCYRSVFFAEY